MPLHQPLQHHQWVYIGPVSVRFTEYVQFYFRGKILTCPKEHYKSALDMTLVIRPALPKPRNDTILKTSVDWYMQEYAEYRQAYNKRVGIDNCHSAYSDFSKYFYDSVWAWNLALERVTITAILTVQLKIPV